MQHSTRNRWRVVATTLMCSAFLVALIIFQGVAATGSTDPVALKPPFVYHADDRMSAQSFKPFPVDATRLLTETFGSGFSPVFGTITTTTSWYVFTDTGSANFYWNRVIPLLSSTYSETAWAACGTCDGTPGVSLDPDTDTYPDNMGTWLIYGSVNLKNYYDAELTFNYLIDADPGSSGMDDPFFYGVSDDGTNFTGVPLSGHLLASGWQTGTLRLTDYAGKTSLYIGFFLGSNADGNAGKGVFVDNIGLRGVPYELTFVPQVAKNYAIATPTPTYLKNYTFSVGGENDPHFVEWGQSYTYKPGTDVFYEQGLGEGNPSSGMYLYNTQTNYITLAGPNYAAPTNFELSVDFNVKKGKDNARYGVVFGADSTTFGRNGTIPTFNINTNYYKFVLIFPTGAGNNDPFEYKLERCAGDGANCVEVLPRTSIPASANADGLWDTLKIQRQGSTISLFINGVQLGSSVTEGTLTGSREVGMFIQSKDANNTITPLEISFDNFRVSQLP